VISQIRQNPILRRAHVFQKSPNVWQTLLAAGALYVFLHYFVVGTESTLGRLVPSNSPLIGLKDGLPITVLTLLVAVRAVATTRAESGDLNLIRVTTIAHQRVITGYLINAAYHVRLTLGAAFSWLLVLFTFELTRAYGPLRMVLQHNTVNDFRRRVFLFGVILPEGLSKLVSGRYPRVVHTWLLFTKEAMPPAVPFIIGHIGIILLVLVLSVMLGLRLAEQTALPASVAAVGFIEVIWFFAWRWPFIVFLNDTIDGYWFLYGTDAMYWGVYYVVLICLPYVLSLILIRRIRLA